MEHDYKNDAEYINAMMKRFKLVDMREQYQDLIQEAEASGMGYTEFLKCLLSVEEAGKRRRRAEKLRNAACFEYEKSLEDIDLILLIMVDTFISKISLPMQQVPEIGSISVA